MRSIVLHDRAALESFLRRNTALYIYHIGDLDEFYWKYTVWFGLETEESLKAVGLLYTAADPPVLLALAAENELDYLKSLVKSIFPSLPPRFYSHLTPRLESEFKPRYTLTSFGNYQKMFLSDKTKIMQSESNGIIQLGFNELDEITSLYAESYPGNSFDPRMLETSMYFGMKHDGKLVSISGVHVYSEKYKVAALGNITTHPAFRGRGISRKVTNHLCKALLEKVDTVGLNVNQNNLAAIKCYSNLGFIKNAPYMEYMVERNN